VRDGKALRPGVHAKRGSLTSDAEAVQVRSNKRRLVEYSRSSSSDVDMVEGGEDERAGSRWPGPNARAQHKSEFLCHLLGDTVGGRGRHLPDGGQGWLAAVGTFFIGAWEGLEGATPSSHSLQARTPSEAFSLK
jgi:hypothetical protein